MSSPILSIAEFKERFDPLLACELERHIDRAARFTSDPVCRTLLAHIKEIALAGGKRIRPYAAYLMYRTALGEDESILESLVSFEIFHTFALVHDDIIDHGALRHGIPSLHTFARSLVNSASEQTGHLAEGLAMLAGDLAFSWSRETFSRFNPMAQTQALFDDMVYAVVLGQMLDVKMMGNPNTTEEMVMEKTSLKTAEYTFVYPLMIGASLAGGYDEHHAWCKTIGTALGVAFQVQDDLLDIVSSEHATGKMPLQDVAEGQHTVFTTYVRSTASESERTELDTYFGNPINEEVARTLRDLFERTGAIAYGQELIIREMQKAREALVVLTTSDEAHRAWDALISRMEQRSA